MPDATILETAALAGLALLAAALVLVPRRLIVEASGVRPQPRLEGGLILALAVLGVAVSLVGLTLGWSGGGAAGRACLAAAVMSLAMVAYVDLRFLVIPDLCSALLAVLALIPPFALPLRDAAMGVGVCGGLLLAVSFGYKKLSGVEGMGFGDVKLAAALGALLGAQEGLLAVAMAAIGAALGGALVGRLKPRAEEDGPALIPYGAALAAAGAGWLIWSRR